MVCNSRRVHVFDRFKKKTKEGNPIVSRTAVSFFAFIASGTRYHQERSIFFFGRRTRKSTVNVEEAHLHLIGCFIPLPHLARTQAQSFGFSGFRIDGVVIPTSDHRSHDRYRHPVRYPQRCSKGLALASPNNEGKSAKRYFSEKRKSRTQQNNKRHTTRAISARGPDGPRVHVLTAPAQNDVAITTLPGGRSPFIPC